MIEALRRWRLEIRYITIGAMLIGILVMMGRLPAFDVYEARLLALMDSAVALGIAGLFLGAFASNLTVVISIPYVLFALSYVLIHDSLIGVAVFSLATGLGGALGKMVPYTLTTTLARRVKDLPDSALYRWVRTTISNHPSLTPLLVFLIASSVLPLDLIILPLALVSYPARKLFAPLLLGKVLHSLSLALCTLYLMNLTGMSESAGLRVDLTVCVAVVSLLVIVYQIERANSSAAVTNDRANRVKAGSPTSATQTG